MKKVRTFLILAVFLCAPFVFSKEGEAEERQPHSGIAGQVVLIRCPVGNFCLEYPYQGSFSIYNEKGKLVEVVEPEEDGLFAVRLKPGKYTIAPLRRGAQ